jgi:hypothetical protein
MTSMNETGHAKNVANFDLLISAAVGYGTAYNPSRTSIQVMELKKLSVLAQKALKDTNAVRPAYTNAVAARETAIAPLSKLSTRLLNALKATGTSEQVIDNTKTLVRKLQGQRATPKKTEEQKAALAADGKATKEVSSSQMSYDSRLDNFDKLIQLLSSVPSYTPNETDLKVETLQAYYDDLKVKNDAVSAAVTPLSNARISRDTILYAPITGLVDVAMDCKTYVKSVFAPGSPQYKQISKLSFTTPKS